MKRFIFCLLFVFLSIGANAQIKTSTQKAVEQTVVQFFDAMSAYDFDKMRSCCTADMKLLEYGEVWNMDKLVSSMKPFANKGATRINTLDFLTTTVNENAAFVIYNNTADFENNGKKQRLNWLESVTLVKEKGVWKMQLLHSTVLKEKRN
ncbi:MAG: nuclear transport factor 2 family protein [Chitinophagaceae bacterium]|nr:MAG: nuclear transport factor 2 family protein [Chitinophagaceae bacterium]